MKLISFLDFLNENVRLYGYNKETKESIRISPVDLIDELTDIIDEKYHKFLSNLSDGKFTEKNYDWEMHNAVLNEISTKEFRKKVINEIKDRKKYHDSIFSNNINVFDDFVKNFKIAYEQKLKMTIG